MVLRVALCVGAAGVVDEAGVDAGATHADLRVPALLVPLAADRFTCEKVGLLEEQRHSIFGYIVRRGVIM